MVYGGWTGHRSDIEEDTVVGLENGPKGVKVRVDPLLVLLLETKNDLDGDDALVLTLLILRKGATEI